MSNIRYIMEFLVDLKANNHKEWFEVNRERYEFSRSEFISLVGDMIKELSSFDPLIGKVSPKDCIFRIYRDTRFSKDKTPYKSNMGAYITSGGRKGSTPGYYLHLEPGESFLAGGIYQPSPELLKAIRQEVYYHIDEFRKILAAAQFKKYFGEIWDDQQLKKPPKDFPADFEGIELLKYRNYTVVHQVDDELAVSGKLPQYAMQVFASMGPFNDFLGRALKMLSV